MEHPDIPEVMRETIRRKIKENTGISIGALKKDAKAASEEFAPDDVTHNAIAGDVIRGFGEGNIIHADGRTLLYKDGVWRTLDQMALKQLIVRACDKMLGGQFGDATVRSVMGIVEATIYRNVGFDREQEAVNVLNGELYYDDITMTGNYVAECGDIIHPVPVGDLSGDCKVDFVDFAMLADNWLVCTPIACP